ncbi:conserved phage C-terminal domain-containing protein [Gemella morbillorum]
MDEFIKKFIERCEQKEVGVEENISLSVHKQNIAYFSSLNYDSKINIFDILSLKVKYIGEEIIVIDNKSDEWGNDPEKRKYLRPGTLFNPKNFNKYLIGNNSKKDKASFEDVMDDYLNGKESDSKASI